MTDMDVEQLHDADAGLAAIKKPRKKKGDVEPEQAEPEPVPDADGRVTRPYVVLRWYDELGPGTWQVLDEHVATGQRSAVARAVQDHGAGVYKAVTARSWEPVFDAVQEVITRDLIEQRKDTP